MITRYYCTNIFSEQAKELIEFYRDILDIPVMKTDMDEFNGVYFGFPESKPTLCIWDCKVFGVQRTGYQSFVFQTDNLDITIECLMKKVWQWGKPFDTIGEHTKFVCRILMKMK